MLKHDALWAVVLVLQYQLAEHQLKAISKLDHRRKHNVVWLNYRGNLTEAGSEGASPINSLQGGIFHCACETCPTHFTLLDKKSTHTHLLNQHIAGHQVLPPRVGSTLSMGWHCIWTSCVGFHTHTAWTVPHVVVQIMRRQTQESATKHGTCASTASSCTSQRARWPARSFMTIQIPKKSIRRWVRRHSGRSAIFSIWDHTSMLAKASFGQLRLYVTVSLTNDRPVPLLLPNPKTKSRLRSHDLIKNEFSFETSNTYLHACDNTLSRQVRRSNHEYGLFWCVYQSFNIGNCWCEHDIEHDLNSSCWESWLLYRSVDAHSLRLNNVLDHLWKWSQR